MIEIIDKSWMDYDDIDLFLQTNIFTCIAHIDVVHGHTFYSMDIL